MIEFQDPLNVWDHLRIAINREMPRYVMPDSGIKLHLGAGTKTIKGWHNLEYPAWDADKGLPEFADESVSEIACHNTLDHLTPVQVVKTLRESQRVLKPGGTFTAITPHYASQLANECLMHSSRFAIDTWRNIFSERDYSASVDGREGVEFQWRFNIAVNFIFGLSERNTFLVTQLVKE